MIPIKDIVDMTCQWKKSTEKYLNYIHNHADFKTCNWTVGLQLLVLVRVCKQEVLAVKI